MTTEAAIEIAMNQILTTNSERPCIALNNFVNNYLPDLAKCELPTDTIIAKWLYISKGPYNEVDVLNPDGSVEFIVPPLWVRIDVRDVPDARYSFNEVMTKVGQKSSIFPAIGTSYFQKCLPMMLPSPVNNSDYISKWNNILESYGYESIVTQQGKAEAETKTKSISYEFKIL